MAIVSLMIPEGFSAEKKHNLIVETKKALTEGLELPGEAYSSIWLQEYPIEDMCEFAVKKRVLIVYTTKGKPVEQKRRVGELFEQACANALCEDKGDTFVIFKEHTLENLCVRGKMKG